MSSLTFTQSVCRAVVAKICLDVGWSSANIPVLNVLIDLLISFIKKLGCKIVEAANHAGRSEPTFEDMALAFRLLDINLDDLKDYISTVEPSPLDFDIPFYPVSKRPNRIFENCNFDEKRSEYYYDWLPTLNYNAIEPNLEEPTPAPTIEIAENPIKEEDNELSKTNNDEADDEENKIDDDIDSDDDEQKSKLVMKINLDKDNDNNNEEKPVKMISCFDQFLNNKSYDAIVNHLTQSKLYTRFQQKGFQDLDDEELRKKLRFGNDEPFIDEDAEPRNDMLDDDDAEYSNTYQDYPNTTSPRPEIPENENIESPKGVTNADEPDENENVNIKVKEAKKKASNVKGTKKDKLSINIKIPPVKIENNDENLNQSINVGAANSEETTPTKTPTKKRQYKRKDKNAPETRGRKPKKIIYDPPNLTEQSNSEHAPLLLAMSDSSNAQVFSPNKNENSFSENDAAKMLVSMSNQSAHDVNKLNDDSISNISEGGDSLLNQFTPELSLKTSMLKKVGRPSLKRNKTTPKKVAISAEVIDSSGDTSGDDVNIDKNPVSLLVNPDISNDGFINEESVNMNLSRKHSNSSYSTISSVCSPIKTPLNSPQQSNSFSNIEADVNKQKKMFPDYIENISDVLGENIIDNNPPEKISKHKKSKKHSKSKHRHKDKEEKSHKKHKHKDKEKHKHKHKHGDSKDRKKDIFINNEQEKIAIRPKLNIKFDEPSSITTLAAATATSTNKQTTEPLNIVLPTFNKLDSNNLTEQKTTGNFINENRKESAIKTEEVVKKKKINNNINDKNKAESENPLIFIKDNSHKHKENKSKKHPIINVDSSLFTETPVISSSTDISLIKQKNKSNKHDKEGKKSKEYRQHDTSIIADVGKSSEIKLKKEKKDKKEMESTVTSSTVSTTVTGPNKEKSCILISETVKVESTNDSWICPICNDNKQSSTAMIGCDSCDFWYHFSCVGIIVEPALHEPWYCHRCLSKKSSKQPKVQIKKKEKNKYSINTQMNEPNQADDYDAPIVSIYPVSSPSTSSAISPLGYKASGRPRGRPRKDSGQSLLKQPSITITPIPSTSGMQNKLNYSNEDFSPDYGKSIKKDSTQGKSTMKKSKKNICLKCQSEALNDYMIRCDICYQMYHWQCVGIDTAPSPDSSWFCSNCSKKHTSKRLWTETVSDIDSDADMGDTMATKHRRLMGTSNESSSAKSSICATCKQEQTDGNDNNWICCDSCDSWFHFTCANITKEPNASDLWFCKKCIKRQRNIENQIQKHKKKH